MTLHESYKGHLILKQVAREWNGDIQSVFELHIVKLLLEFLAKLEPLLKDRRLILLKPENLLL